MATLSPVRSRSDAARTEPIRMARVIAASSVGSAIEWYDFFVFGALAPTLAPRFYPPGDETVQLLLYLSTFAVGFVARPFGALVFGRIGDLVGRKHTFIVTLMLMGTCTAAVALLPGYETIGYLAPGLLVLLRVVQGLAIGGEYGGAAVYVAEHAPDDRRGFYTSFIQMSAVFGLLLSIVVVVVIQHWMSPAGFASFGYRIPFLVSLLLVVVSLFIRVRMNESPLFAELKEKGRTSKAPIRDALRGWEAKRQILRSLFGLTSGLGVLAQTASFYALFYMTTILKVETEPARVVMVLALFASLPLLVVFAVVSDRIGRKRLMMAGLILGAVAYLPIYHGMQAASHTGVVRLQATTDPITKEPRLFAVNVAGRTVIQRSEKTKTATHGQLLAAGAVEADRPPNYPVLTLLVFLQSMFFAMVYGPAAAYLVEAFPAAVRYTSLSLPYHLGFGVIGGLLPTIGLYVNAATKSVYAGLTYPIVIAGLTFVIGTFTLEEGHDVKLWDEIDSASADQGTRVVPSLSVSDEESVLPRGSVGRSVRTR
jgi:MFS family permease